MIRKLVNRIIDNAVIATRLKFLSSSVDAIALTPYTTTITVANGATTGVEAAISLPANFLPVACSITNTVAATNAVNLTSIGIQAAATVFVTGITVAANSTGYKGMFGASGARGLTGVTGALTTPDEVMITLSGNPGATGATFRLTFLGLVLTQ